MARIEKITNRTDLLAFVYDPETLPTAIIHVDIARMSVHGLREGEDGLLEKILEKVNVKVDPKTGALSKEAKAYRFYEDLGYDGTCYATHFSDRQESKECDSIESWATKTFLMCA